MARAKSTTAKQSSAPNNGRLSKSVDLQHTIGGEVSVHGIGFVTGADVTLRFKPAPAGAGITFVRTDLKQRPEIPALVRNVVERRRRTALHANGATVEMTEHVLAALSGLGIDNCIIELDAGETPGMDGSSMPFVAALQKAGVVAQQAPRTPFIVDEPTFVGDADSMVAIHPNGGKGLQITFNLDYGPGTAIGKQSYMVDLSPESFSSEIAGARTFVLMSEVEALLAQGIGSRSTAKDLLVFGDDGCPIENQLRFPDECVRHKILDVIGDIALLGRPLHGHILAHKSGHQLNTDLVRKLDQKLHRWSSLNVADQKPLLDIVQIQKLLPHRYPFLLVDRVLEMDPDRRAVGIKNVTCNEPFFQGHWPDRPVMPGVLIVEAMAQLAGLMFCQWQEQGGYAMVVSLDNVKLRRPVTPGDQLVLEAESIRVKSRVAVLRTRAFCGRELAAEAQMSFVHVPGEKSDS